MQDIEGVFVIRIFLIVLFSTFLFANDHHIKLKDCEVIRLSKLTDIVSCSNIDYLVEYDESDEQRGEVKKVTAVTVKDARVIKGH